jgi:ribosome biogenesis protein MAK21
MRLFFRYFADQPLLSHPDLTDRHLLLFAFEDYLKKWFFNLLQVLEVREGISSTAPSAHRQVLSHDTLPYVRVQGLHAIFQLLAGNAEQEQNLLRLGINKLVRVIICVMIMADRIGRQR